MKVWIMYCLNLGSVLNIYKIILNFLHFSNDFEQNIYNRAKENGNNVCFGNKTLLIHGSEDKCMSIPA